MTRKNEKGLPTLSLDLTKVADARRFLAGFHMPDGNRVLFVVRADQSQVAIKDATDEQAVQFASQIYTGLYAKGVGFFEDVH